MSEQPKKKKGKWKQSIPLLFYDNNGTKAEKIKAHFEKSAKTYPHQGRIQAERELIELADKKFSVEI